MSNDVVINKFECPKFTMFNCDCRYALSSIESNSIDLVITDPPYFIDGMGDDWDDVNLHRKMKNGVVGGLPVGMKFDPNQGKNLQIPKTISSRRGRTCLTWRRTS